MSTISVFDAYSEAQPRVTENEIVVPKNYVKNAKTDLRIHIYKIYETIDETWRLVKTNVRCERNVLYVKENDTNEEWEFPVTDNGEIFLDAAISWFLYPNETLENMTRTRLNKGLRV